jgi:hypothetical protein
VRALTGNMVRTHCSLHSSRLRRRCQTERHLPRGLEFIYLEMRNDDVSGVPVVSSRSFDNGVQNQTREFNVVNPRYIFVRKIIIF